MDIALLQLEVVDDQATAFHMEDLHGRARLVHEDERVSVLDVAPHLVGHNAAERVEALAHVGGARVQEEPVAVVQAEHPLAGQHDETAESLQLDTSAQADGHTVGIADLANGLLDAAAMLEGMVLVHENHFAPAVVDAHRQELSALAAGYLLTELALPMVKAAFRYPGLCTEPANGLSTAQELLVDGLEVIDCPHMIGRFCGRSYGRSVRIAGRGLPNAYEITKITHNHHGHDCHILSPCQVLPSLSRIHQG